MRLFNVVAMAATASAVVIVAYAAAIASPRIDPAPKPARGALIDIVAGEGKSVMIVTRAKTGRLHRQAAAAAVYEDAFSIVLGRTFQVKGGDLAGHSAPLALPPTGPVAGGFVAAVDGYGGRCGFAIGGLDFSGQGGVDGLDASAALIFCAESKADFLRLATPELIAGRIARLRQKAD